MLRLGFEKCQLDEVWGCLGTKKLKMEKRMIEALSLSMTRKALSLNGDEKMMKDYLVSF